MQTHTHTRVKCVGWLLVNEDVWSLGQSQQPTAGLSNSVLSPSSSSIILCAVSSSSLLFFFWLLSSRGVAQMEAFLIQEINYLHLSASSHTPTVWLYVVEYPIFYVCVCVCSPGIVSAQICTCMTALCLTAQGTWILLLCVTVIALQAIN